MPPERLIKRCSGWAWLLCWGALALASGGLLAAERLVSVDGSMTETLYALGQDARLVGVDTTSTYPPKARELPSVGYKRALSAEGLLSLAPDLVLGTEAAGPPEVLSQIRAAGVEVRLLPDTTTLEGLRAMIRELARTLDVEARGERLIEHIEESLERLAERMGDPEPRPRVLFLMVVGSGIDHSAGRGAPVDHLIALAGGQNVLHDAVEGYRPLSPEAALAAAPDVILVSERALQELGGIDGVLGRAGLAATPAGQARRVIALDSALLFHFGPRLAEAAESLALKLGTLEGSQGQPAP